MRKLALTYGLLLAALTIALPIQAHASPFDTGYNNPQTLFTRTIAKVASIIAIVLGGIGFATGEPGAKKNLAGREEEPCRRRYWHWDRHSRGKHPVVILDSASIDLLQQSGESLAGRITYIDMGPFNTQELPADEPTLLNLWLRGGFPGSYLAGDDTTSMRWRVDFIRTYLERDVSEFGPRIPAGVLERLWTMLAHGQGTLLNNARLASGLQISAPTVGRYIDLLSDLLLVRRLAPFHRNDGKRLVKSPKVYVRDSGLVHALLGLKTYNDLAGHPVAGSSWEGCVIENLLAAAPERTVASFYRTAAGAEIDLLLDIPGHGMWAIEVKRSLSGRPEKGFYIACEDLQPDRRFVVNASITEYAIGQATTAIEVAGLTHLLASLK